MRYKKILLPLLAVMLITSAAWGLGKGINFFQTDVNTALNNIFNSEATFQKVILETVRTSNAGGTENCVLIENEITGTGGTGGSAKTYGISIDMARTANTTIGDIDDAGIKVRLNNYATANTAGNTLRGVDVQVKNNLNTGVITNLNGGSFATSTKSSTSGKVSSAIGLSVANNLDGECTDLSIPLDVRSFRQAAAVPTTEAIARFRNGNTTGTGIATGILITSEAGTPARIVNGIDMDSAVITGAEVVLSSGAKIYTGTAATRAAVRAQVGDTAGIGDMYIGVGAVATTKPYTYIKVIHGPGDTDWERVVTQASD